MLSWLYHESGDRWGIWVWEFLATSILGGREANHRPAAKWISDAYALLDKAEQRWFSSSVIKNLILFGLLWVAVMPQQPTVHAFDRSVLAALHAEGSLQ